MYDVSATVAHTASQWHHDVFGTLPVDADCICSSERQADVMAAILKRWHHNRKLTPPVSAYICEEHSYQMSSQSKIRFETMEPYTFLKSVAPTTRCLVICGLTDSLPESVRGSPSLPVFRNRLKTELFARSFSLEMFPLLWHYCVTHLTVTCPCSSLDFMTRL